MNEEEEEKTNKPSLILNEKSPRHRTIEHTQKEQNKFHKRGTGAAYLQANQMFKSNSSGSGSTDPVSPGNKN
jgi:hypothetical protein